MKNNIRNRDENGNLHGKQISYHSNDNISWIYNYHHGKYQGYQAWFNIDKSIFNKSYYNMGKRIYSEYHWSKQIGIKI